MHMHIARRYLMPVLLVLVPAVLLKIGWEFFRIVYLEWQGAFDSDIQLYFTVGRGILNNLIPYIDLFESKPPGMFLLTALSLFLGGVTFVIAVEVFLLLFLPIIIALFTYTVCKKAQASRPWITLVVSAALLLGMLLSLYAEYRAGALQTELFGGMFGALYALLIIWRQEQWSWRETGLAAFLLLISIGMKEPFLLSTMAAALLLIRRRLLFLPVFLLPLGIAMVMGTFLLMTLGMWEGYISIYLPTMLHYRIASPDPLLMRGLLTTRIFYNLTLFNTVDPLLGYLLLLLFLSFPLLTSKETSSRFSIFTVPALLLLTAFFLDQIAVFTVLSLPIASGVIPPPPAVLRSAGLYGIGLFLVLLPLFSAQYLLARKILPGVFHALVVLYLASLSVGIGGNYNHYHFVFALPLYVGLVLIFLRHAAFSEKSSAFSFLVITLTLLTGARYHADGRHLMWLQNGQRLAPTAQAAVTEKLDSLLDQCNISRYFMFDGHARFVFTKHSPWGPIFAPLLHDYLPLSHSLVTLTTQHLADDALIIVGTVPQNTDEQITAFVRENFTTTPPRCAEQFLPIDDTPVLFRS